MEISKENLGEELEAPVPPTEGPAVAPQTIWQASDANESWAFG